MESNNVDVVGACNDLTMEVLSVVDVRASCNTRQRRIGRRPVVVFCSLFGGGGGGLMVCLY